MVSSIEEALATTPLRGREVREVRVPGSAAVAYELDVEPEEAMAAQRAARSVVDRTSCWPVICEVGGADVYSRDLFADASSPAAVVEAASALTIERVFELRPSRSDPDLPSHLTWPGVIESELHYTRRRVGSAPDVAQALAAVPDPDLLALERWLLDWEELRLPTIGTEWPEVHEPFTEFWTTLALLPTADPWEVPAYKGFWTCQYGGGHATLVRALRSWHERFGATPMVATATQLVLDVERPVDDLAEAFAVATELDAFSEQDYALRMIARAVLGSPTWALVGHP